MPKTRKLKNKRNFSNGFVIDSDRSSSVFGYTEPGAGKKKFEC